MPATKKRKPKKPALLSRGRPPTISHKPPASLSSKVTRTLISSHHQLHKALVKATAEGDAASAANIKAQIENQGGLEAYQAASITGQGVERGGDSSKVLMEWLAALSSPLKESRLGEGRKLKMLEVGALKTDNACSRSRLFDVTRIDLHAQAEGILQQDFMQRPHPETEEQHFHIISLSLVLNYVPDASGRGEMLKRTRSFLHVLRSQDTGLLEEVSPSLFLVLPASCVVNSRYINEERLTEIMESLGFVMIKRKMSAKLVYYLWRYTQTGAGRKDVVKEKPFRKEEIRAGRKRNNFAIVLH
ncbi:MAG: hypothetical protein M1830_003119 [Pleopsidium flavum]|nr:MAG: hypothetical protein M1830_003119 [Pleopsidium flavum]